MSVIGEEVLAVEQSTQVEYKLSVICTSVQLTSQVMGDNKQQLVVSTDKIVQLEEKSELLCISDMTLSTKQPVIPDMTDDVQQVDHNKSQLSTGCVSSWSNNYLHNRYTLHICVHDMICCTLV